jgi:hypothetical protein
MLPFYVTFSFPPFPPVTKREFKYFTSGVSIAIENIAEGREEQPLLTLLKLIENLEKERPEVSDWPRRTVMSGSEYVYEAFKAVCEDVDGERGLEVGNAIKEGL